MSAYSVILIVVALVALSVAADPKWEYKVSQRPVNQEDAVSWCRSSFQGELVSIETSQERDDVQNFVRASSVDVHMYWTALERKGNPGWAYSDGKKYVDTFNGQSAWKKNEPNFQKRKEFCVAASAKNSGLWNDVKCWNNYYAVCKRKFIANPFVADRWYGRDAGEGTMCYYKYFNHILYKQLTSFKRKGWFDAEGSCNSERVGKAHLATIHSQAENDFVKNLIYKVYDDIPQRPVWLGSRRSGTEWKEWTDGSTLSYTNWIPGEPNFGDMGKGYSRRNERCLQMSHAKEDHGNKGKWNDANCDMHRGYVCELCTDKY